MSKRVRELPPIPAKQYFTIGEASKLCDVKPHVLRYWEQEFSQLRPVTRKGDRRYYQQKDIKLVRLIRELLYIKGYTIAGAKPQLQIHKAKVSSSSSAMPKVSEHKTSSKNLVAWMRKELEGILEMAKE
jgi:DNA-binding transcriptional MerR regulator